MSEEWIQQVKNILTELPLEKRGNWETIRKHLAQEEPRIFESSPLFKEESLLRKRWLTLVVQQMKLPRRLRLPDEELIFVRKFLATHSPGDQSAIHELMDRANTYFRREEITRSEAMMSIFGLNPTDRNFNERNLLLTRALDIITPAENREPDEHVHNKDLSVVQRLNALMGTTDIRFHIPAPCLQTNDGLFFPAFITEVPGMVRRFQGGLRPAGELDDDHALLRSLQQASKNYHIGDLTFDIISALYCVVLLTEPTPYDQDLPDYMNWIRENQDEDITHMLSMVHAQTLSGQSSIVKTIRSFCSKQHNATEPLVSESTHDELLPTIENMLTHTDWSLIKPGDYDLIRVVSSIFAEVPHPHVERHIQHARLL